MSTLEVCLVRHAQSVSNARNVWQGQGDSPLSETGRAQTAALRRVLGAESYDLVLSSDLTRAADTARAAGVEVELQRSWREIDVGEWEGLTMDQVVERFPEQIEALKARRPFAIGGGESWPEVFARADASLAELRARMPRGGRALVFTHGGIIAALLSGLLGARERFPWPLGRMRNTGRTTLVFRGEEVHLVAHNDDSHIPGELRQPYRPRPDQVVVHMTSVGGDAPSGATATTDFNSEIKAARNTGAGGVVSVSGTPDEIATVAQATAAASTNEFKFVAPPAGGSSLLLISSRHDMLLDYGLPPIQI